MTKYQNPIYSVHVSADNVLLCVRTSDGGFVTDSNLSPDDAEAVAKMLTNAAREARKIYK